MKGRRTALLGLLGVLLVAVLAWRLPALWSYPRPPRLPSFESGWATEQEWLVDQIVRDLAEMAAYASTREAPKPEDLKLTLSQEDAAPESLRLPVSVRLSLTVGPDRAVRKIRETLRFEEHVFSPRQYEGIARTLVGSAASRAPASASSDPAELLQALLDLRAPVLVERDRKLSARLAADPLDPSAHEEAALLLGAFALRDAAGCFTDTRPALSRMTAHLAMAGGLRQGSGRGLAGQYAEAILLTLAGREKDALSRLTALEAGAGPQQAWVRALRLRNTGDWRLTADAKELTLLERLEEARALTGSVDDMLAAERFEARGAEPLPDWGRILLQGAPGVQVSNRFAQMTLYMEMAEISEVWQAVVGGVLAESAFVKALNEPPGRLVSRDAQGQARVAVLGWPAWAFSGQRHLLQQLLRGEWVLRHLLGLKEEAKDYTRQSREKFGGLAMYPIVQLAAVQDAEDRAAKQGLVDMARRHPEWMTGGHWRLAREAKGPGALPDERSWFLPLLPSGTLLDVADRLVCLAALRGMSPADLRAQREAAPSNMALATLDVQRNRAIRPTIQALGPLADYHLQAMKLISEVAARDPVEGPRALKAMCALVPEQCRLTAERMIEAGQLAEAAEAYQRAFDHSRDRVQASNTCDWLVDYYFERGETKKALAVAQEAAATHSHNGLFVLAYLTERLGHLPDAERQYQVMAERYEAKRDLMGFYYRQARLARRSLYEARFLELLGEIHRPGLISLDRASLPSPPKDGMVLKTESYRSAPYGIRRGHVVVGLDGLRVRTAQEYDVIRGLSPSPRMVLLVWRGSGYDEIEVNVRERTFGIRTETYAPSAPAPTSPRP